MPRRGSARPKDGVARPLSDPAMTPRGLRPRRNGTTPSHRSRGSPDGGRRVVLACLAILFGSFTLLAPNELHAQADFTFESHIGTSGWYDVLVVSPAGCLDNPELPVITNNWDETGCPPDFPTPTDDVDLADEFVELSALADILSLVSSGGGEFVIRPGGILGIVNSMNTAGQVTVEGLLSGNTMQHTGALRLPGGTVNAQTLTSNGLVEISGGNLAVNSSYQVSNTLTFLGGLLTANNLGALSGATVTWTSGEVLASQVTFAAGSNVTIGPSAVGSSSISNLNGGMLNNSTTVRILGGHWWINAGATVNNQGTLRFEGPGNPIVDTTTTAPGTIQNSGTVHKDASASTVRINRTRLNNTGTVQVDGGVLDIAGGGTSTGDFQVAADAEVLFGTNLPSQLYTLQNGTDFTGAGFARVTGAVAVADTQTATANNFHVEGLLSAAGVGGGGTLVINDELKFTSGIIQSGTTRIVAGAELKIEDGSPGSIKLFDVEHLLDNEGMTTWTGTGEMWINRGSTFHNNPGATFRVQNATVMDTTSQQSGRFLNEGLFEKTSAGTTRINRTLFDNDGMVDVQNGVLDVAGGGTSTGSFQIAPGAEVRFGINSPTQVYTAETGATFAGGGLLRIAGNLTVPAGHDVSAQRVQLEGQLAGPGAFSVANSLEWPSGLQLGGGTTEIEAGATMTISGAADKTLTASRVLENHGTANWTGGRLLINDAAEFRNESDGVFHVNGGVDMDTTSQAGATFTNLGEFRKTSGGVTRINRTRFNTEGDVFVDAGELDVGGGGASQGVFNIAAGAGLLFGTNAPNQLYTLNTLTKFNGLGFARVTGAVTIPTGELVAAERFHIDGGFMSGGGMLIVEEEFKFSAGLLSGGVTKIEAGADWMLSGAVDKQLAGGHTVDVFGDGTWQGTGQLLTNGGSRVRIRPGANVDIQSDLTIDTSSFPAGAVDVEGTLSRTMSSGVVRFARTALNNQGVVDVSAGTLQVAGGGASTGNFTIAQGAVVDFPAGSLYTLGAGTTMTGAGFAQLGGTLVVPMGAAASLDRLDFRSGLFLGPGTLTTNDQVLLGGAANKTFDGLIVENHADATWTGAGMVLLNNGVVFNNRSDGAFYAETDGVIDSNDFPAGAFNNVGALVKRNSGGTTRFFRTGLNNSGLVDVQSGTLRLEAGGTHSGSFQMAGGTSTQLAVGLHTLAGGAQFGGSGLLRLNGGISQVPAAAAVSMQNVELTAGALNVDGQLTASGEFTWTGGALSINNAGAIVNNSVNTFNASVSATVMHSGAATSHFVNAGAFQKTASTGTTRFSGGIAYDNSGVTNVGAGSTLQLSGGGTSTGPFHVAAGGVLLLDGFTPYMWNAGTVIDGSGFARVTGLVHTPAGVTASVDRLQLFGGTLGQAGVVQVNNDFTWTFGTLATGTLAVAPQATATIAGVFSMTLSGNTLANYGTLLWTSGTISSASSPTINNHLGAVFDIQTSASLVGPGTLNNDGLLTKSAGVGTSLVGFATTNTGAVEAASGTLQFAGGFSQTAGATTLVGGNLASSTPMNFFGGALAGSGAILGQVNNLGAVVSPGLSAGLLQVSGYTQAPAGTLEIEITGTSSAQFDRLEASAGVTLGGTLDVSLLGFQPAPADTFAILTAVGGISGAFANAASGERLFTSDGQGSFLVHYGPGSPFNPNQVVLSQFLLVADFDEDGDVDSNDLMNWKAGFGASGAATHLQGDADGDLDVDGADFLVWQRQLGSVAIVAASELVPEPGALTLMLLAGCGLTLVHPRRR